MKKVQGMMPVGEKEDEQLGKPASFLPTAVDLVLGSNCEKICPFQSRNMRIRINKQTETEI